MWHALLDEIGSFSHFCAGSRGSRKIYKDWKTITIQASPGIKYYSAKWITDNHDDTWWYSLYMYKAICRLNRSASTPYLIADIACGPIETYYTSWWPWPWLMSQHDGTAKWIKMQKVGDMRMGDRRQYFAYFVVWKHGSNERMNGVYGMKHREFGWRRGVFTKKLPLHHWGCGVQGAWQHRGEEAGGRAPRNYTQQSPITRGVCVRFPQPRVWLVLQGFSVVLAWLYPVFMFSSCKS